MERLPHTCWWTAQEELYRLRIGERDVVYVEGWGVRRRDDGKLEPFQHGWVEVKGEVHDVTPDHGCLRYFGALRFEHPRKYEADHRIDTPFHRDLVPTHKNGDPNPHHDATLAAAYEDAQRAAEAYCNEANQETR